MPHHRSVYVNSVVNSTVDSVVYVNSSVYSEVNPTEEAVIYQEEGGKGLKDYSREHLRYLSRLES